MRFNSEQIQKIGKEISNKVEGKTLFDEFSRGRYSTDASVLYLPRENSSNRVLPSTLLLISLPIFCICSELNRIN